MFVTVIIEVIQNMLHPFIGFQRQGFINFRSLVPERKSGKSVQVLVEDPGLWAGESDPAEAGISWLQPLMDSRSPIAVEDKLRGSDGLGDFLW